MASKQALKAPFPYFGGKGQVYEEVWKWLGDVKNFVEAFFGSGAILLGRPHWDVARAAWKGAPMNRVETVNDIDGYVVNFWRAVQANPEKVAYYADWPVTEADLHARHDWLMGKRESLIEVLVADPEFYDEQIAGWWVWGMCCWIGSGWCSPKSLRKTDKTSRSLARLGGTGVGVNGVETRTKKRVRIRPREETTWRVRIHMSGTGQGVNSVTHRKLLAIGNLGRGVNSQTTREDKPATHRKITYMKTAGQGVNSPTSRQLVKLSSVGQGVTSGAYREDGNGTHRKMPSMSTANGRGAVGLSKTHSKLPFMAGGGRGVISEIRATAQFGYEWGLPLVPLFEGLAARLRHVRVSYGDWKRVCTDSVTWRLGVTGVFLDPPYSLDEREDLYPHESTVAAKEAREWAIANGDNPLLRIALCGYDTEHEMYMPEGWHKFSWKAQGGYGNQSEESRARQNAYRETIWFSPHCIDPYANKPTNLSMFEEMGM